MNPDDRGTYLEGLTGEMTYLNPPDSFKCKICFPCENFAAILIKAVLCQFYFCYSVSTYKIPVVSGSVTSSSQNMLLWQMGTIHGHYHLPQCLLLKQKLNFF